jgi:hypothetical protein
MAVDKKKRDQRRKRKILDKIRKGREVYFPPLEFRLIDVFLGVNYEINDVEKRPNQQLRQESNQSKHS